MTLSHIILISIVGFIFGYLANMIVKTNQRVLDLKKRLKRLEQQYNDIELGISKHQKKQILKG
jgi:uncharacterized membrane protein YciS (DUF1049 family)